jgi:hypothetical protein
MGPKKKKTPMGWGRRQPHPGVLRDLTCDCSFEDSSVQAFGLCAGVGAKKKKNSVQMGPNNKKDVHVMAPQPTTTRGFTRLDLCKKLYHTFY